MCKMCVKKGPAGAITFEEDAPKVTCDKSLWRGILVFAEQREGKVHPVSLELVGKARELAKVTGHPVYALLIGNGMKEAAEELLCYGVDRVFVYDDIRLRDFVIGPYANAFCDMIDKVKPSSILVGATVLGRSLAPKVAARCHAGLTADCTILEMKENTDLVQIRPAFGGNIMAQIVTPNTRPQFCTVRYKVFAEPKPSEQASGQIVTMPVSEAMLLSGIEVCGTSDKPKDVDIAEADVIVAIGRGASGEAMRNYAKELADLLGGMLACSRPLVESNLLDAKHQIGLSGRTVKPKLIFALGISGAVQFAAGMKSSDCIVAINSDPAAPIFDVAHYCVVGDVNEIVPKLIERIRGVK